MKEGVTSLVVYKYYDPDFKLAITQESEITVNIPKMKQFFAGIKPRTKARNMWSRSILDSTKTRKISEETKTGGTNNKIVHYIGNTYKSNTPYKKCGSYFHMKRSTSKH